MGTRSRTTGQTRWTSRHHTRAPVDCLFPERGGGERRGGGDKCLPARRDTLAAGAEPSVSTSRSERGRGRDVHAHADRDEPHDPDSSKQLEENHDERHGRVVSARRASTRSQEADARAPFHCLGGRGPRRSWTGGCGRPARAGYIRRVPCQVWFAGAHARSGKRGFDSGALPRLFVSLGWGSSATRGPDRRGSAPSSRSSRAL